MVTLQKRNKMDFFALALGGLFLCNPVIGFYDVLPDLFGYALIYWGLWKLSDLCDDFAESMTLFRNLIFVSVGQMALQWLIYDFLPTFTKEANEKGEIVNQYESPMLVLLASFVWAVLTWYYLLPAFKHLFAGFGALANGGDGFVIKSERKGKELWERIWRKSAYFSILLPLLSLLPELSILTTLNLKSDAPTVAFDWYRFITLFRTVLGIAAGVIGLWWLVAFVCFLIKILRDHSFLEYLEERYQKDVIPRVKWRIYRRISVAFAMITVGLLFAANIRVDDHPVFHGGICAILICLGYTILEKPTLKCVLPLYSLGAVLGCVSHIHWNLLNAYLADHALEEALHIPRAYDKFFTVRIMDLAENILLGLFIVVFIILIWRTACNLDFKFEGAIFGKDRKNYLKKISVASAFAITMAVFGCVNAILQLEFPFLWWITLTLCVVMVFIIRSFIMDVKDEMFSCAQEEKMNRIR